MKKILIGLTAILIPPAIAGYYFVKFCQTQMQSKVTK